MTDSWDERTYEAMIEEEAEERQIWHEHMAHVRAERAASDLTSVTELEVHTPASTLEDPVFWVIEVSNNWYWDIQIEDFIEDQGLDVLLWFDFYRSLATWCPVEDGK